MELKYLNNYTKALQEQIVELISKDKLSNYLINKYPIKHEFQSREAQNRA